MACIGISDEQVAQHLEASLLNTNENVPFMRGKTLWKTLGFGSEVAYRLAISEGRVGVRLFKIPGRKGYHALIIDIVYWLSAARSPDGSRVPAGDTGSN